MHSALYKTVQPADSVVNCGNYISFRIWEKLL